MTKRTLGEVLEATRKELTAGMPLAAVNIPLIRRIMPGVIAQDLCAVQPMSSTSNFMHALRTRFDPWGCRGWCVDDSWGYFFENAVDFPQTHPVYKDGEEVRLWAVQNIRKPFTYAVIETGSTIDGQMQIKVWRWTFFDQDEAFQFKVRWM